MSDYYRADYYRAAQWGHVAAVVLAGTGYLMFLLWTGGLLDPWPIAGVMGGLALVVLLLGIIRRHRRADGQHSAAHAAEASHWPDLRRPVVPLGPSAEADDPASAERDTDHLDDLPSFRVWDLAEVPAEDLEVPSERVVPYLYTTERFYSEWRRHGARLAKELAVGAAVAWVLVRAWPVPVGGYVLQPDQVPRHVLVGCAGWVVWVVWRTMAWHFARLVLTTVRVLHVRGVLLRRVSSVPLASIAHIGLRQSPVGRWLGYGALRFAGVGILHPLWRLGDLVRAHDTYLQLVEECFAPEASAARRNMIAAEPRL